MDEHQEGAPATQAPGTPAPAEPVAEVEPADGHARGLAEVADLVERYRALGKAARGYSEARTVNEFIGPLFAALGWDMRNSATTNEVIPEETVSRGRVDWAFRLRSVPRFYLEAKRPSVDLDEPEPAKQAITYAYNKGVTWAVLTNFERLRVYNAEWDAPNPNLNLFYELRWEDYPTDERLWWLSRDAVRTGVLDAEAEKVGKRLKKTPVGERLFSDLLTFRTDLRNSMLVFNQEVAVEEIDHAVQRLLDRLIFIRTAEDRRIEEYHLRPLVRRLQDANKSDTIWPQLLAVFQEFEERYDSQLFAHQRLDTLDALWHPVQEAINGLYETKSGTVEYDFSAIDADVLGGVYEQYLGQLAKAPPVVKKTTKRRATKATPKEDTRPFRKAQGVYYTPKWVVRLIVHATLGRMLEERSADEIREVRLLDPACGSGSFLIEAFRVLAAYWREKEPPKDAASEQAQRVGILTRNIFGIDLDPQAVEIAQLNLLLVALVDRTLLPDLSRNVVVGNTLVDSGRDTAFDVAKAFPFPANSGLFDAVIGNPPYVRAQNLPDADREYFKGRFKTATGSFDLYQLFLERALELTMTGGRIGFIVPGKFLSGSSGQSVLLDHLYAMGNIEVLVDAMRHRVFESALTYPVILVEQRGQEPGGHTAGLVRVIFSDGPVITWVDEPGKVSPTLVDEDLPADWTTIESIARVSQALVTGADNVFALTGAWREPTARLRSASVDKVVEVESELLKPLVSGSRQVSRFAVAEPEDWLLFPYRDGKLIPATTMETTYPLAWAYLEGNRARLEGRDGGDMKGPNWYGYSRTQNLSAIWHPKVLVPYMNIEARAAADPEGKLAIVNVTTGGYFVAPNDEAHLDYLTAALNSRYAEAWWRKRATPHAGGYFGLTARAIGLLPIPDPTVLPADVLAAAGTPSDADDDPFVRTLRERLDEVGRAVPAEAQAGVATAVPYAPDRGRG